MSEPLLRIAFRAAKIIMRLRLRKAVASLTSELRRPPRALIGQRAWETKAQFLGYLLFERHSESAAGYACEPLTFEERELLSEAHAIIVQVNRACLAGVSAVAPDAASACDPYAHFPGLEVSQPKESLSSELLDSIRLAMMATPAVKLFAHFGGEIPPDLARGAGEYVESRLLNLDADSVPLDLLDILRPPMKLAAQASAKLGIAVVAARHAIRVVDQLLYQAFMRDKLFSFDESNVFAVPCSGRRGVGVGHAVESLLPEGWKLPLDSGEVVVLAGGIGTVQEGKHVFCSVGNMVIKFSQDAGSTMSAQLRELDDHACEFSDLVKSALALQGVPGDLR
jgi:hypothetical protein